jgi:hypothetical protein
MGPVMNPNTYYLDLKGPAHQIRFAWKLNKWKELAEDL